jgi:hypothetical protein
MKDPKFNIEDFFLSFKKEKFPNDFDYSAKYKTIKEFMDNKVHSEIKSMVTQKVPAIYLNDHGEKHIKKVIEKASELISRDTTILTPYEIFFLLVAIQIHDAGHVINGRDKHAENASKIIKNLGKETITSVEKKYISQIAKAHSGKNDPIGNLSDNQLVSNEKVNLKLIASILRLADELADDSTRASSFLLDQGLINESSKIFHHYSNCLDSCIAESNQIRMNFFLEDQHLKDPFPLGANKVFLLDEIYDRTVKTFTESLYCNRFLPEVIRIKSINVDINIETSNTKIHPDKISYRLEENGYPQYGGQDIFEMCTDLKSTDGKTLNGLYYSKLI